MAKRIPTLVVRNSQGKRICSVDGCEKPHIAKGFCREHDRRAKVHGHPLGGRKHRPRAPVFAAFKFFTETVLPFDGDECLIWPILTDRNGYGLMVFDGKRCSVHREACKAKHGPPPTPKHQAAHSCGRGAMGCVNPNHLRWATAKQNGADMVLHGRSQRGARQHMAKLTEPMVREIRALHGTMTHGDIAGRFGVSRSCVSMILGGRIWAWLAPDHAACADPIHGRAVEPVA
jgi:hypothetical protein